MNRLFFITFCLFLPAMPLAAQETYTVIIKDHQFAPAELTVPAHKKIKITIENQDPTPEEFESHDLKREKIIPANGKAVINVGPLRPGKYSFVGEFHEDTAKGTIVVQ
jgi:hypothetical protein